MNGAALVQLALKTMACTQKQLADKLKVSPTQVSLWKKGEYISAEMEDALKGIVGIGDMDPSFVQAAGSVEDALKWQRLIKYLAEVAYSSDESGYETPPLQDDLEQLCADTFQILPALGVTIPSKFPEEIDFEALENDEDIDAGENLYSDIIFSIFKSLTDVYGFYAAYIHDLLSMDGLGLESTEAMNIPHCLLELAATKIEVPQEFAQEFSNFKIEVERNYMHWLDVVKLAAFRAGVPLKVELMQMVRDSHDLLGHTAEAECLGFNNNCLHPDIYMNELLIGMRAIHQALPAIMKKLGIYDEFQLDESKLRR